jgi:hypothetical protein
MSMRNSNPLHALCCLQIAMLIITAPNPELPELTAGVDSPVAFAQAKAERLRCPGYPPQPGRRTLWLLLDTALPRPPLTFASSPLALDPLVPVTQSTCTWNDCNVAHKGFRR